MSRMIFDLPDDDRAALERLRVAWGYRTYAEVLRTLIRRGGEPAAAAPAPAPKPSPAPHSFSHGRSKTVVVETKRAKTAIGQKVEPVSALGEKLEPRGALPKGAKR